MRHICSNCGNVAMQRSSRKGLADTIWSLLGFYPWRCHRCTARKMLRDAGTGEPARVAQNPRSR